MPIAQPDAGAGLIVAQIPIGLPGGTVVESISLLGPDHDLLVYDLGTNRLRELLTGAQILRNVQGRTRQFLAEGTPHAAQLGLDTPTTTFESQGVKPLPATSREFQGYDRLADGMRLRFAVSLGGSTVELAEVYRFTRPGEGRTWVREVIAARVPATTRLVVRAPRESAPATEVTAQVGRLERRGEGDTASLAIAPDASGAIHLVLRQPLPPPLAPRPWQGARIENPDPEPGALERPGYRAVPFPRPRTVAGEDRVMPAAMAVDPRDGRLFVSSLKTGELFVVKNPRGAASDLQFENYAEGLFQDTFALLAESDGLKVLHRRNLSNVVDTNGDGRADRVDRVLALPHGVADTYDYAYGVPRDRTGAFIVSYAPHANHAQTGAGNVMRMRPGQPPQEIAFGLRNPLGWASGPEGEIFFTDNQGEWVASNKLAHVEEGKFYGYPNPAQKQHADKPLLRAAVWVPYAWARSINGLAFDQTGGKFGPFAGQFFLAELTFGGAIVRANVEKVNGHYQGACFPFWGKGLLGPVSLAFDPAGPLYVGGITEPGWMAQPDRGALFRIDFTGSVPFEIQSIHALPRGFRLVFTRPIDPATARAIGAYTIDRFRYEYTGAYGSPELDRARVGIERVEVAADGRTVDLTTASLVADHVYMISAPGVRSPRGESLLFPGGAYTLNQIPGPNP
ncbi:MAG: hypothetical protein U0794_03030 [Isosphaeraceae bacterium]